MNSKLALRNSLFWATALALGTAFAAADKSPDQAGTVLVAQAGGAGGGTAGGNVPDTGKSPSGTPANATDSGSKHGSGMSSGGSSMSGSSGTMSGETSGATGGSTSGMSSGNYKTADEAWKAMNTSNKKELTQQDLQGTNIDFAAADANHDGKLSKAEFDKAWNTANKAKKSSAAHDTGTTSGFTGGSTGSSSMSTAPSSSNAPSTGATPTNTTKSK